MTDVIDSSKVESTLADLRCRVQTCVDDSEYLPEGAVRRQIGDAAVAWVSELAAGVHREHGTWRDPMITDNDDNQIVFEWWNGDKKLSSRVGPKSVELIRRWGARTARKREEITSPSAAQTMQYWGWLMRDGDQCSHLPQGLTLRVPWDTWGHEI